MTVKVAVFVSGGVVQRVESEGEVEVYVVDYDNGRDSTDDDPRGCYEFADGWASVSQELVIDGGIEEVLEAFEEIGRQDV